MKREIKRGANRVQLPDNRREQVGRLMDFVAKTAENEKNESRQKLFLIIITILGIILLFFVFSDWYNSAKKPVTEALEKTAQVHFIDVEQGDCTLIISDDGSTVLIDCGERKYSADVLNYLDNAGVERLDYVIVTHPHSDHMGGMSDIIDSDIEIGTFIMPEIADEYTPTTSVYERMLRSLSEKGCAVKYAETESLTLGSGELEIITVGYFGDNYNNYSPILRFIYGSRAFLFTGDAETDIEEAVLAWGYDVRADVYNAGHHGSSTSSCAEWVRAVNPQCFVISCGAGNSYGHPHRETIELAGDYTDIILRTDLHGDIVFTTDGEELEYYTEKE